MTVRIRRLPEHHAHDTGDEERRLRELRRLEMLDSLSDDIFDGFTSLLATALRVPIAVVSIVDRDKVWFKSSRSQVVAVQRDLSFCSQTICGADLLIVEDATRDTRFSEHPAVRAVDGINFYAGTCLHGPKGFAIGSCCVMDRPRVGCAAPICGPGRAH
jgi:GAF domain-containing protein